MAENGRTSPQSTARPAAMVVTNDGGRVLVPDDVGLLTAEFSRRGPDLAIGNPDAPALVVLDYFVADTPADLATTGGGVLPGRLVETLAGPDAAPGAGPEAAGPEVAGPEVAGPEVAGREAPIGHVEQLDGEVLITHADGSRTVAGEGTPVFQDDVVTTDGGGAVGLRFVDDMTLSLGSDARMVLDEFAYDPATDQGGGIIDIIQGAFSFVSGKAAHVGLDSLVIDTPTMTIGIRGTKVVAQAAAEGETTTVVLMPEDDGTIGKIMIGTEAGQELLEQPFVSTTVTSRFLPPAPQTFVAPDWVSSTFSKPLAFLPPEHPSADSPARDLNPGERAPISDDIDAEEAAALDEQPTEPAWAVQASAGPAPGQAIDRASSGQTAEVPTAPAGDEAPSDPETVELLLEEAHARLLPAGEFAAETGADGTTPVVDDNAAPVVVAPIAASRAAEDAVFSYDVAASFADDDTLTFSAEQGDGTPLPAWLTIDAATGMLSGTPANGDVGGLTVEVTATDASGARVASSFQLTVSNSNDAPVVVTPIADTSTAEDVAFSYDASSSFADDDGMHGDTLSYSAELSGAASLPAWLTIDATTGMLSGTPANGDVGVLDVEVTATDGSGASVMSAFQLTVTNNNDTPVVVAPIADTGTAEDAAFSYDVATSFADDDTIHGDTLAFSAELAGGTPLPAWLSIDPATGVLSGTPANGDVGVLDVEVTATDGVGASVMSAFQLTVTNGNDAPVVVTPIADTGTAEDAAFSYDVATSFADADTIHGDTLAFTAELSGGAPLPAWLSIDPATGVLSGTPANGDVGVLDVEVTATDTSDSSVTSAFRLTVTNNNDTPVVVTPIADANPTQSALFTYDVAASFADDDSIHGDALTFDAVESGGTPLPGWLTIDPATGILSGTPGAGDVGTSITVEVTATDGSGASVATSFQLTVDNTNDAPVVVTPIADTATAEDAVFSYDVAASFNDADGEPMTFTAELAGGTPLPAWLAIDPATGVLSGTPSNADVGGLTIEVTAADAAGANVMASFQLTVSNSNDAPVVVTPIADTGSAEDAAFSYDVATSFADADTIHGDTLAYSAELSGGTPLPAWLSIDAATGVLSGTPANGDVGVLDVEVTATDGVGASALSAFQLTVTNSNDAPVVVTPIADTATAEDAAFSYDAAANFADVDSIHGDTLAFSAELLGGTPLPAWLAIDPVTGVLSGTPANGDVGVLDVEVTATDGVGASALSAFQLTVTNSNDAPVVVTPIADTGTAEDAAFSYDIAANFSDDDSIHGDTLAYSAELTGGTPLPAWLSINAATGVLSGTPANGDVGVLEVEVTATDGSGATATSGFDLTVTNTNDAPLLDDTASPTLTAIAVNTTDPAGDAVADIVVDGSITDVDGPAVEAIAVTGVDETNGSWEYSTDAGNSWFAVGAVADNAALLLDASGRLRFVPDAGFDGNATFTFRAWDQTVGSSGEIVDASVNGGTTAYSATSDTGSIAVVGTELDLSSGSEFQINTNTIDVQRFPSIAALGDGGFVTIWQSNNQDGDAQGIFGQRFDAAGNPAGVEFQINTYTTDGQQVPSVAGLDSGGFVVTWQSKDQDGDVEGIFGQRFDAAGSPSGVEFQINTQTVKEQQSPSVAALDGGGFVVAWQSKDQDGDTWGVFGQRFDAAGSPQGAEFQVNTTTAKEQESPSVAALDGGGFVVTWQSKDQDGGNWGVYGQRFDAAGSPQGAEFQVNTTTAKEQETPSVAALTDGGFVVAWQSKDQDGDNWGIYGQRFDAAGNPVEFEFQINTTVANEQQDPSIIGLADGGFLVTWQSKDQDGDNWGVYGQRFNADGDALGQEFLTNTTTADAQWQSTVTSLADGDVVAAWTSRNQDGDSGGVFGHHYENETASVTVNPPVAAAASRLDFGSSNSSVDMGDPGPSADALDPGSRDVTVEAWFYYAGPNGLQSIVSKGNATEVDPGFNIFLDGSELVVRVNTEAGEAAASKVTMSGVEGWYHVAMVVDQEAGVGASQVKGYLGGSDAGWNAGHGTVLDSTFTTSPGGIANGDRFLIGAVYDSGVAADFFDGEIADVRVWNTARSAPEIQADLGRTLDGDEANLIANWRLDDGAGGTATDNGPGGYDGSLGGGPAWESATGFTIARDTSVAGRISATDAEGDVLSYGIAAGPANGTAAIDPQSGAWTYTPDAGYSGGDSVSYQVSDGNGGSDTVAIAITVTP